MTEFKLDISSFAPQAFAIPVTVTNGVDKCRCKRTVFTFVLNGGSLAQTGLFDPPEIR